VRRASRQRLDSFVEEWWALYAQPNLERSTLAVYRWAWEHHARPHLGSLRLRDVTPLTVARFRASLEARGAGVETIRKTLTMLQSVFQRAVEWQLLEVNPVRAARKPPLGRARAVPAIGPRVVEAMRADLLARDRVRDARLIVLLAYAGLRPGEALGLEWRHVRERTLLVEQAVSDGELKGLKNRRRPRAVRLLAPLRDDLSVVRVSRADGGRWLAHEERLLGGEVPLNAKETSPAISSRSHPGISTRFS
jgi:integrase